MNPTPNPMQELIQAIERIIHWSSIDGTEQDKIRAKQLESAWLRAGPLAMSAPELLDLLGHFTGDCTCSKISKLKCPHCLSEELVNKLKRPTPPTDPKLGEKQ